MDGVMSREQPGRRRRELPGSFYFTTSFSASRARGQTRAAFGKPLTPALRRGDPRHRAIPPRRRSIMSNITLYTNDENTATGIREASFEEILDCARRALAKRVRRGTGFTSPRVTADYLRVRLSTLDHEVFCVIYLTKRHQFIACEDLFRGTIDGASVYPREVLKEALKHNAAAVILAHNHPSGVAEPSQADLDITRQLKKVLDLVEIKVLDHIIIAGGDTVSFAERGLV